MGKALVLDGGGRGHAIGWKLAQSTNVDELYFAPGNAGTAQIGANLDIAVDDVLGIKSAVDSLGIDLVIPANDAAVASGVVDALGNVAYGPTKAASRLEWDKIYSHEFTKQHNIPSPDGISFDNPEDALAYVMSEDPLSYVIKAYGPAKGKGVVVPHNQAEAEQAVQDMMVDRVFGDAGDRVLFQERIEGKEVSILAMCVGEEYTLLPLCQDYKRRNNGDTGPNTGGVGVVAPVDLLSELQLKEIEERIIQPTLHGIATEGASYHGVLYVGVMITKNGIKVIEYNARDGDPEAQGYYPLLDVDLYEQILRAKSGKLEQIQSFAGMASAVVTLTSPEYPKDIPPVEREIFNLKEHSDALVFHSGTRYNGDCIMAYGGRILHVVGLNNSIEKALQDVYSIIGKENDGIYFDDMHYRTDIGCNR